MTTTFQVDIDGRQYTGTLAQKRTEAPAAPRLVVVAYQPNKLTQEVLRVCIETIQKYTPETHELWIVDNNSPIEHTEWLLRYPALNVVLNRVEPIPPEQRSWHAKLRGQLRNRYHQRAWGSYANAIGLEIAIRLIDPQTQFVMPLHMDTMPCQVGWLTFLRTKITEQVAAAGVRLDHARVKDGVLHVLGYLVDFQRFRQLKLDFLPDLPRLDVGDRVTVVLRQAGYGVFACRNTLHDPAAEALIAKDSPFKQLLVDRALNDQDRVIFLHQGRGVRKSTDSQVKGVTTEEWVQFADNILLAP